MAGIKDASFSCHNCILSRASNFLIDTKKLITTQVYQAIKLLHMHTRFFATAIRIPCAQYNIYTIAIFLPFFAFDLEFASVCSVLPSKTFVILHIAFHVHLNADKLLTIFFNSSIKTLMRRLPLCRTLLIDH